MKKYYVVNYDEIILCFKIKEGYIPCEEYRPKNSGYYIVSSRDEFCIPMGEYTKPFKNQTDAELFVKKFIIAQFLSDIENAMQAVNIEQIDLAIVGIDV